MERKREREEHPMATSKIEQATYHSQNKKNFHETPPTTKATKAIQDNHKNDRLVQQKPTQT